MKIRHVGRDSRGSDVLRKAGVRLSPFAEEQPDWLDRLAIPRGYAVERSDHWRFFRNGASATRNVTQGWKLHVAARAAVLGEVAAAVTPLLFDIGCDFKIVASAALLKAFNDGMYGAAMVGKAITIYPDQERVAEVALRLADRLRGYEAPRICSDRRVCSDAPIYYRFGPFSPRFRLDEQGRLDVCLTQPDGVLISGVAGERYNAPEWVEPPFPAEICGGIRLPKRDGAPMIGDHYRVTGVIARTYRGATYRAADMRTGERVVIKHVNAFVNESEQGDARTYLRNEIRILRALDGIERVPRVVDHFAYGEDEYLVTTELGVSNLRNDIVDNGILATNATDGRDILRLAKALLALVDAVHERDVVIRDLAPKNVVPMDDGGWGLIDFELSRLDDVQMYGWTPGYAHAAQRRNDPSGRADDYYALGATLIYALSGLDPVTNDGSGEIDIESTLASLGANCGWTNGVIELVAELLAPDPGRRSTAAARLRKLERIRPLARSRIVRRPDVGAIFQNLAVTMADAADDLCGGFLDMHAKPPSLVVQNGTAGLIAELARHPDHHDAAVALARASVGFASAVEMPIGLLYGRMGLAVAISSLARATNEPDLQVAVQRLLPGRDDLDRECRGDFAHGLAGLGFGYLSFALGAAEPLAHALADRCAQRLVCESATIDEQLEMLPLGNPAHAISIADGFAHGRAGIANFLLAHSLQRGNAESAQQARGIVDMLITVVPRLATGARSRTARAMCGSWCQGLAGIGTTLVRAANLFEDERYLRAAREAAEGCLAIAPRVPLATQCCGLAGIGEFFLDLSRTAGGGRYRRSASHMLELMLMRSGGLDCVPQIAARRLAGNEPGWGSGGAGILSFLRRMRDPLSSRLWM